MPFGVSGNSSSGSEAGSGDAATAQPRPLFAVLEPSLAVILNASRNVPVSFWHLVHLQDRYAERPHHMLDRGRIEPP